MSEPNKQKKGTKNSSAILKKDTQNAQSTTTTKNIVPIAVIPGKVRNNINAMSFSNIISIVSNSIFRVFSRRIYGQEIHDENQENKLDANC